MTRTTRHLATIAAAGALVLVGCTVDEPTGVEDSTAPEPVAEEAPDPERPEPDPSDADADPALTADLERFCRAHDSALDAVDAFLADDAGDDDAVTILIGSLEAMTSTLAAELRADEGSLHPRAEPLVAAAEQTAADAREALDADHGARDDFVAEQLAGASHLQPLVDDPDLYETATSLAACADLPLGAVAAELGDTDDRNR